MARARQCSAVSRSPAVNPATVAQYRMRNYHLSSAASDVFDWLERETGAYDAIVIGAGPAGSTAALLLARAGWSVAIVEKSPFPRRKVCGEFISAPALALLARLDLADRVAASAGPEIRSVAVFAGERVVEGAMPGVSGGVAYGRALGRDQLDAFLLDAALSAGAAA